MRLTSKHLEQITLIKENSETVEQLKSLYPIKCDRVVDAGFENWLEIEVTGLEESLSDQEDAIGYSSESDGDIVSSSEDDD